jgi:hypothetical protein
MVMFRTYFNLEPERYLKKINELGVVVHPCNPRYMGGKGRRISSSRLAQAKVGGHCLKKQSVNQRSGGCNSRGRALA